MRTSWALPPQAELPITERNVEEVLVEFNGPQILTARYDSKRYLAVASDEDTDRIRWVEAPLSDTELEALMLGGTTPHMVLSKPGLRVVDTSHSGNVVAWWKVEELVAEHLPEPGVPLVGSAPPPKIDIPEIRLDGPAVVEQSLALRPLAKVLWNLQRLWTAIVQAIEDKPTARGSVAAELVERSTLHLCGMKGGSVRLLLRQQDRDLFALTAERYRGLTSCAISSEETKKNLLHLRSTRVRSTLIDYLSSVRKDGIEAFVRWDDKVTFLNPEAASLLEKEFTEIGEPKEDVDVFLGYFNAFSFTRSTFEFRDIVNEEIYYGNVDPNVLRSNRSIVVGEATMYLVSISAVSYNVPEARPQYHLVNVKEYRQEGQEPKHEAPLQSFRKPSM